MKDHGKNEKCRPKLARECCGPSKEEIMKTRVLTLENTVKDLATQVKSLTDGLDENRRMLFDFMNMFQLSRQEGSAMVECPPCVHGSPVTEATAMVECPPDIHVPGDTDASAMVECQPCMQSPPGTAESPQ